MNLTTKVFAFISGVTLTAYAGNKLRTSKMEETFAFEGNTNCNLGGKAYFGRISGNSNSNFRCDETSVELVNNRNMKVNLSGSTVKAVGESNSDVSATSSTLEMKSNKNIQVDAEDAWCSFKNNQNLNFKGKGGANDFLSQFIGNQNGKFTGKSNRILAFDNQNISIEDDNNDVKITGTRNHNVRPAPSGSNENTFTIRSSGKNSFQFVVEYVDSAVIDGPNYQLGRIKFNAVANSNKVKVTLNEANDVIYSVAAFTPDKILIQAESNGITQKLELKGERVEAVGLNSYYIFVNSA